MKKITLATTLACILTVGANAAVLFNEPFDINGTMLTSPYNDWSSFSGAGTLNSVTAASGLVLQTSDHDYASSTFTAQTGTAFLGFDLNVDSLPTTGNTSTYFAGFLDGSGLDGRIYINRTGSSTFTLGVSIGTGTINSISSTFSIDTSYRVVSSYNATTDSISLWVGSYVLGTPGATATGTDASTSFNQVFLRQGDDYDNGASTMYIENLVVTDTFATAVPEPTSAVMLLGGVGMMFTLFRRKRVTL